jgi:hypothetical protein
MRRAIPVLGAFVLVFLVASPAEGGGTRAGSCGLKSYSYAGVQADDRSHGVSATLDTTAAPNVSAGHVGGWVGLGGVDQGPGGTAEWIQAGLAAFASDRTSQMYYEVAVAGSAPQYVEIARNVRAGVRHRFTVLEMSHRASWWRVWVDGRPVSPPIHLPGSHDKWHPQVVAENWNGGADACNLYSYRFSDVSLAQAQGGVWRPLESISVFQDVGYHVVPISDTPRSFVAASLAA